MISVKVLGSGSKGNCYLISDGETSLLLDAGLSGKALQEGTGFALHSLEGCLITHTHSDHIKGANWLAKRCVHLYGHPSCKEQCPTLEAMVKGKPEMIGTWIVRAFAVEHDAPCYGFLLVSVYAGERLVYVTDAARIPYKFQGVDYWMVEANYSRQIMEQKLSEYMILPSLSERIMACHMSIESLAEYFKDVDLTQTKEIWLLHLSDTNSNAAEFRRMIQALTSARVRIA